VRDRAASTRVGTSGLHVICETWIPTVLTLMTSRVGDLAVRQAVGEEAEDL
jgi:hypothetical protein